MSIHDDLKIVTFLNQANSKPPPNLNEAWSTHTVKKKQRHLRFLDFMNWLKAKAEKHESLLAIFSNQNARK